MGHRNDMPIFGTDVTARSDAIADTYAAFRYIPPKDPEQPLDCRAVTFTKFPKVSFTEGSIFEKATPDLNAPDFLGIEAVYAEVFLSGSGGVHLLIQVTTFLRWEVGFINKQGKYITEVHRIRVALPMWLTLQGPRMALMAISPLKIKVVGYADLIVKVFAELKEIEEAISTIMELKKGMCPKDIKALTDSLETMQTKFNERIQRAAQQGPGGYAMRMERAGENTGRFAGLA